MSGWDRAAQHAIGLVEPGFIEFAGDGTGQFGLSPCAVGWTAARSSGTGRAGVMYTWDGVDEGDQVSGRGWAYLVNDETTEGYVLFHLGDDSSFRARPFYRCRLSGWVVSEYQYYEFLAIDRPLDDAEQAELRSLSTRARITATRFVNEYHWGNFRGDPNSLVERYYDAHLYVANWGSHRVMFRLPCDLLDPDVVEDYCVGDQVSAWVADGFVVLYFTSEDHAGEFDFEYDAEALLSAIVGVRAELATGDHRALYLVWLAAYGAWERDEDAFDRDTDDDLEPPVPPGLGALTAPQRALAHFLRLDDDLLAIATRTAPPLEDVADPDDLATWVARLPATEKDRLLGRVAQGEAARVRMELLRRFRDEAAPAVSAPPRRRVADLLDAAAHRRANRESRLAAQRAEQDERREEARALARARRLDELAREENAAWSRVEAIIATRKPVEYDDAVELLADLQALAERDGHHDTFTLRTMEIRQTHARKASLIERLNRAGI